MNWYPIFLREILIFKRRVLRLGFVLSTMLTPLLYLLVFGVGLGRRVSIGGSSYLDYLMPGLVAVTSMINSYTWIANGMTVSRLFFRTFQIYIQAPVSAGAIMWGEVLAGMVRGLFASIILLGCGWVVGSRLALNGIFLTALLVNCFLSASMGVIVGLKSRSHDDAASFTNFFIMPMAFFSGTFFPVEEMPWVVQKFIFLLPLTHTNILLRYPEWSMSSLVSFAFLVFYGLATFWLGILLIRRYDE
ncbi:ABC transporter permease [Desulfobacca acetoxidans]|uniref:Transport permease protein n=1 Tax=Desulfobacca acetoxidans (strain ATCC 700848 / DSM 11109 / ASRB2) TaxID=880072 RepID=F2NF25_DESAR|nr:ABC transporter permease [Desulfobacca acetoxidans]AEB08365.1 ABC-2 type transporter [Desulfobacca acetoxidans DSM 11109]